MKQGRDGREGERRHVERGGRERGEGRQERRDDQGVERERKLE